MTLLAQKIDPFGQVHSALGWAPSLPVVRAGLRGGCWIFFGKTTRFAQTSFSLSEKYPTPPYRRAAQDYQEKSNESTQK